MQLKSKPPKFPIINRKFETPPRTRQYKITSRGKNDEDALLKNQITQLNQIFKKIEGGIDLFQVIILYWKFYDQNGDVTFQFINRIQQSISSIAALEKLVMVIGLQLNEDQLYFKFLYAFLKAFQFLYQLAVADPLNTSSQFSQMIIADRALEHAFNQFQSESKNPFVRKFFLSTPYESNLNFALNFLCIWMQETQQYRKIPVSLRCPPTPYLSSQLEHLVLVVDLDETLVHYLRDNDGGNKLLIRPGARDFVETLQNYYRLVVWTASLPRYARWALKRVGQVNDILTRQHCVEGEVIWLKELKRLGYPLNQVLIVENDIRSVPDNERDHLLLVDSYREEDENDRALVTLQQLLVKVAEIWKPGQDVLDCLKNAIIQKK